ncbi:uncharacterized protein LOC129587239 [Paramacrobiotus metropolitanus]|uniref:uncharacterized protein LOC129587239 n=1 Tax=Paramacrobiotus metropolitanus TaxID=2943436 RepID=UPI002445D440|nr:uncharacterized protein LOC129587239 [Paramacrobiotus metropolitanus]
MTVSKLVQKVRKRAGDNRSHSGGYSTGYDGKNPQIIRCGNEVFQIIVDITPEPDFARKNGFHACVTNNLATQCPKATQKSVWMLCTGPNPLRSKIFAAGVHMVSCIPPGISCSISLPSPSASSTLMSPIPKPSPGGACIPPSPMSIRLSISGGPPRFPDPLTPGAVQG